MQIKYKLTEQEVIKAMQFHGRGSNKMLIFLTIAALFLLFTGLFTEHKVAGFLGFIGEVVGYFSVLFFLIPAKAKKQYKLNRVLRNNIKLSILDDGFKFKNEIGESKLHWADIQKWKYSGEIYLLYISSNMFHIVPSKAFPSDCDLSKILSEHVGPKKS
jgi:hypothetical protein